MGALTASVTIANGASVSDAFALQNKLVGGFTTPATWTAAKLGFQVSFDNTNFFTLTNLDGTVYELTIVANKAYLLDYYILSSWNFVKAVSISAGTPVNQGQASIITFGLFGL